MVVFNVEKFDSNGTYIFHVNRENKVVESCKDSFSSQFFDDTSKNIKFFIQESALTGFYAKTSFKTIESLYQTQTKKLEKLQALGFAIFNAFKVVIHSVQGLSYLPVNRAYSKVYLCTAIRDLQELIGNITMIFHYSRGRYWVDQANFHKAVYALYGIKIEMKKEEVQAPVTDVQDPLPPAAAEEQDPATPPPEEIRGAEAQTGAVEGVFVPYNLSSPLRVGRNPMQTNLFGASSGGISDFTSSKASQEDVD